MPLNVWPVTTKFARSILSVAANPEIVELTLVGLPSTAVSLPPARKLSFGTPSAPPTDSTAWPLIEIAPPPLTPPAKVVVPVRRALP